MSDVTFGQVIEGDAHRDAVHVAVAPVVAGEDLYPGQHIGMNGSGFAFRPGNGVSALGVVDPYLKGPVSAGQRFYLFLYQNTVTGMRHHWAHPAFPEVAAKPLTTADKAESERWLRDYCRNWEGPDYDTLLKIAGGGRSSDDDYHYYEMHSEYLHSNGSDAGGEIPPEVWDHVEAVTGKRQTLRPSHFSCSC